MDIRFDQLFKSIDRETFIRDYLDRKPLHDPGAVRDVERLFSWEKLNDLLERPKLWDGKSVEMAVEGRVVDPQLYCRPGVGRMGEQNLRPDRAKVAAQLQKGATFVLDFLEGVDPEIAAVTRCLERLFGSHASCNMYCSWKSVAGYGSHFDTMDVFAIQIAGEKIWNLYEGRFPEATFTPGIRPFDYSPEQHDKMKRGVAQRITMRPGDILYLPRGLYHDALATDQASLHLSFGVTPMVGFTVAGMLASECPKREFFRKRLPHFEDRDALAAHLSELGDQLKTMLEDPAFVDFVAGYLKDRTFEKVAGYRFPDRGTDQYFFVTRDRVDLEESGDGLSVRKGDAGGRLQASDRGLAEWVLGREVFWLSELVSAHGDRGEAGQRAFQSLIDLGIVTPIHV